MSSEELEPEKDEQRRLLAATTPTPQLGRQTTSSRNLDEDDIVLELDTFDAAAADLLKAAAAVEAETLPDVAERSPCRRKWCSCCGTLDLPDLVSESRRTMQKLAKVKMAAKTGNDARAAHEAYLTRIFTALVGRPPPGHSEFEGEHWMDIGFQGSNPATDLRAAGMLAVLQLLYLTSEQHLPFAHKMLALSQHEEQNFPFATVSINMTAFALIVVRSRQSHRLLMREVEEDERCTSQMLDLVNRLYARFMQELERDWRVNERTIVDFQEVSERLLARCLKNPLAFLERGAEDQQNGMGAP